MKNKQPRGGTRNRQKIRFVPNSECFFKVIDISYDGSPPKVQFEAYTDMEIENGLSDISQQEQGTIRLVLDGRKCKMR